MDFLKSLTCIHLFYILLTSLCPFPSSWLLFLLLVDSRALSKSNDFVPPVSCAFSVQLLAIFQATVLIT